MGTGTYQQLGLPTFAPEFLDSYAGRIMANPDVALVELVANAWDAGAGAVELSWPDMAGGEFSIADDGVGMTLDEFRQRWMELSYSRAAHQGTDVAFPEGVHAAPRRAFGRNGKGRHAMFCFADPYRVATRRDGIENTFEVTRRSGSTPFSVHLVATVARDGHGTCLSARVSRNPLPIGHVKVMLGSKFVADPSFRIIVNGEAIELADLSGVTRSVKVDVSCGSVPIHVFDSLRTGRISGHHGVAWWVNRRLVGQPTWDRLNGTPYLDARTREGKRYTFVVEADAMEDHVLDDWSGFDDALETKHDVDRIEAEVTRLHRSLLADMHRTRKRQVVAEHRDALCELSPVARFRVGKFVDELQGQMPTVAPDVLSAAVGVLVGLEKTRSGYSLLEKLSQLPADDLDGLHALLEEWSIAEIRMIVDELDWRLRLIVQLQDVVERKSDELHEVHPLFERGLWIFGPEYEGVGFISNRSVARVIREFFGDAEAEITDARRRPDIVSIPNAAIEIYTRDHYDDRSEVDGIDKVVVVELKRGDYQVVREDLGQAADYAAALRRSGKIGRDTAIVCFVLGTTVAEDVADRTEGNTDIHARPYSTVLRQAETRTFNLKAKLEQIRGGALYDSEVEAVLVEPEPLFADAEGSDGNGRHG